MKGIRFSTKDGQEEVQEPLLRPLFNDLVECERLLEKEDTQFARRTFVRAAFAFKEGFLYYLKESIKGWSTNQSITSDPTLLNKMALLNDDFYKPNKQGVLQQESNRLPFLNYCAFIFRTAAEICESDPAKIFADNGWNEVQKALQIRHRITHPKKPEDLDISDSDLFSVREAHRWIFNSTVRVFGNI